MLNRIVSMAVFTALVASLAAGCGAQGPQGAGQRAADGFSLSVLPASFVGGGAADGFALDVRPAGDGETLVEVRASGAHQLKALYFELDYDAARYAPVTATATGELAGGTVAGPQLDLLQLAVLDDPGQVHCGQVLPRWGERPGFSGDAVLARMRFRATSGAPAAARSVSVAPSSNASRTLLTFDAGASTLHWGYYNQGDYDQNREVNISDLTPLGANLGANGGPFDPGSSLACIDGDSNGELNISDLTPIGANYGRLVSEYAVFVSSSAMDYPDSNTGLNGPTASGLGTIPFGSGAALPGLRTTFSYLVPAPQPTDLYWVRPRDGSSDGTPSNMVSSTGDIIPTANLAADVTLGPSPLTVHFDASASFDLDGNISNYTWDLDGDTVYETNTGASPTASFTYSVDGPYLVGLAVYDNQGFAGNDSLIVFAGSGSQPAVALLSVSPMTGPAPLDVTFDASSSFDPGGTITGFAYDFEGDGTFESGSDIVVHQYTTPGVYNALLGVTDNDGTVSFTGQTITVTGGSPQAPIAVLLADQTFGQAPSFTVNFDASNSSDPDGTVAGYEYDFDGDGVFDSSGSDLVLNEYTTPGFYNVELRVTDDGGNTASDFKLIQVNPPGSWHAQTVDSAGDVGNFSTLLDVGGFPAIAYWDKSNHEAVYVRATDALGGAWDSAVLIDNSGAVGDENREGNYVSMALVDGNPAAAYFRDQDLYYVRASDANGTFWGLPTQLDGATSDTGSFASLAVIDGNPAIAYYEWTDRDLMYIRADSTDGASWLNPIVTVDSNSDTGTQISLKQIGGQPGISYRDQEDFWLHFAWGSDPDGALPWNTFLAGGVSLSIGERTSLADINGLPAIAFENNASSVGMYVRALDASFTNWGSPVRTAADLSPAHGMDCSLAVLDGNPVVAYAVEGAAAQGFTRAADTDGEVWGASEYVDPPGTGHQFYEGSLAIVDGKPAVSYYDDTTDDLKFAIYY